MQKRTLGTSGLEVAPLAFGGNIFGWTVDETTSFTLLDAFTGAGFNLVDTADIYSRWAPGHQGGESETIIGRWFKHTGKRSQVILATKAGMEMSPDKKGLSKAYLIRAVEDSLRRLQTDYIDLYQAHTDDLETPLEETLGAYAELIQQGKVRAIGASNYNAERLAQAFQVSERLKLPAYQTLQPLYNLYDRTDYEAKLEPLCREKRLGVITYFSLASGFLTGKYRSEAAVANRPRAYALKKYFTERGFRILAALDKVAEQQGANPAQVALAWIMARPTITAPIASATTLEQLQDLIAATQLTLSSMDIQRLNQASD